MPIAPSRGAHALSRADATRRCEGPRGRPAPAPADKREACPPGRTRRRCDRPNGAPRGRPFRAAQTSDPQRGTSREPVLPSQRRRTARNGHHRNRGCARHAPRRVVDPKQRSTLVELDRGELGQCGRHGAPRRIRAIELLRREGGGHDQLRRRAHGEAQRSSSGSPRCCPRHFFGCPAGEQAGGPG